MLGFLDGLFDTDGFYPRWNCGDWSPAEGWLHIISDSAIYAAYTAIPLVIGYFVLRRKDVPFSMIFWLFGAFILACGTTHLLEVVIFWHPVYRLAGVVKLFTALVSWGTVFALVKVTPAALRWPSLAKLNTELTTEVKERKQSEVESERNRLLLQDVLESERAARTDAERANQVKDEFLSLISHELRAPLNAILGYAQLLRMGHNSPAEIEETAEVIERSGWAQAKIIEDLLDMSRITSGKMRLSMQTVDLCELVNAAVDSLQPAAQEKEIQVRKQLDPSAGRVLGDAGRLQQILWNLLSNAIKFTPQNGRVDVALRQVDSHVEISVADTGKGIKAEFLAHIFDRFSQQDATMSRRHGGLGLGLAIVKHLVDMHGGTVQVQSDGENKGCTFTIKLPLPIVPGKAAAPGNVRSGAGAAHPLGLPVVNLAGLKVLVVDDEADSREIVRRFLEEHRAEVTTAESAKLALAEIHRSRPDLIVSDIGMPQTDGYQFMRQLRSLAEGDGGKIPAVAVTAFARSEDRTKSSLAGYQAHVTKPINPASELIAVIAWRWQGKVR